MIFKSKLDHDLKVICNFFYVDKKHIFCILFLTIYKNISKQRKKLLLMLAFIKFLTVYKWKARIDIA